MLESKLELFDFFFSLRICIVECHIGGAYLDIRRNI